MKTLKCFHILSSTIKLMGFEGAGLESCKTDKQIGSVSFLNHYSSIKCFYEKLNEA